MEKKLLLFDLDGTLLTSKKTISPRTLAALNACRRNGWLIGVSTSRAEANCLTFVSELQPDVLIASGGAVIKCGAEYVYLAEFSPAETRAMIQTARRICGEDCQMTVDTVSANYWNYKIDPTKDDASWGGSIYTDFEEIPEGNLKFCVEMHDPALAEQMAAALPDCDCARFTGGFWYKFTKKEVTKEHSIHQLGEKYGIIAKNIIAFGDDWADLGMLRICGTGVAMGNAIEAVKAAADVVISSNDEDGIAEYLEKNCL